MGKKVVYYISSPGHRRVFESTKAHNGLDQTVVAPIPTMKNGAQAEDYSYFNLKDIRLYRNLNEAQKIIKQINPNILVQADTSKNIVIPKQCTRAFVGHGMIGTNIIPSYKYGGCKTWQGFDVYFGATDRYKEWIWHAHGNKNIEVYKDCLPQLDLLYDENYYESYRQRILKTTKNPGAKKVITFFGFCCKDRNDFQDHLEDYFKVAIWLEKIARKNNYIVFLRPRNSFKKTIEFLKTRKWKDKYLKEYAALLNSKYIHNIVTTNHIYRYYFSDIFVVNGTSTAELEICMINKPLIVFRSIDRKGYDPFETVTYGAALHSRNYGDLEQHIEKCVVGHPTKDKQQNLIKSRNIVFDGKANERISDILYKRY